MQNLFEEIKMNWVGELCQKEISPNDKILDLGCGKGTPTNGLKCRELVGLDIFKPWLLKFNGEKIYGDIRFLPFKSKSFDVVLVLDVLEHLDMHDAKRFLRTIEDLARRKIIVYTPRHFFHQDELGNPFNQHKCLVSQQVLQLSGYKTWFKNKRRNIFAVKKMMRILHVWCQAGVSGCLAKYQKRLGYVAHVVKREGFDGLKIDSFYRTTLISPRIKATFATKPKMMPKLLKHHLLRKIKNLYETTSFYVQVMRLARNYDVVHIHSLWQCWFWLPFKKKVLLFHGDDIREQPSFMNPIKKRLVHLFIRLFSYHNTFYVSTSDLTNESSKLIWIPNPVDTEHFQNKFGDPSLSTALYFRNWYETSEKAEKLAQSRGWNLTILDRTKNETIPYQDMPRFLFHFTYFIDRHKIPSLSKTALEALALGLKVVAWDGSILEGLESIHKPEVVAQTWLKIYEEL